MTVPNVPRASDRVCAGCGGQAVGFGVVAKWQDQVLWCCGEPDCYLAVQGTYKMPEKEWKHLEQLATVAGGEEAGAYLDELGKFALDALTEQEWAEFCRRLVGGYRHALHVSLRNESPF